MEATAAVTGAVNGKGRRDAAQPPSTDRFRLSSPTPCKAKPAQSDSVVSLGGRSGPSKAVPPLGRISALASRRVAYEHVN